MKLSKESHIEEAKRLHQAEKDRKQVKASTVIHSEMDIDDAYQVQSEWMSIKKAEGRTVAGYKIGLTSRAMQKAMNINEPDYGTLLDDMVFEEGTEIDSNRFLDPKIEVGVGFLSEGKIIW